MIFGEIIVEAEEQALLSPKVIPPDQTDKSKGKKKYKGKRIPPNRIPLQTNKKQFSPAK